MEGGRGTLLVQPPWRRNSDVERLSERERRGGCNQGTIILFGESARNLEETES